jgi:uncharacterized repeat protein (TIGR01451 family)
MSRPAKPLALALTLCLPASLAMASGTPAGVRIDSQAMVAYTQAGTSKTAVSNLVSLPVNEVLDFTLTWQDAAPVPVHAGELLATLSFQLQNTGNGEEAYHLTVISALAGDDFDPGAAAIHFDADGNGSFDPLRDTRYDPGTNDPSLAADARLTVFLVSTVPDDAISGQRGDLKVAVGSQLGYGAPGTVVHGQGDGGTDAIIGLGGGFAEITGTLQLASVEVRLVMSAAVVSGSGQELAAGTTDAEALVTYTIDVVVSGSGTARDVVVTDPFPAGTTYQPGTLRLNAVPLTDADDADAGDANARIAGTVTVALGDLTAAAAPQRISFQVALD